MIHTVGWGRGDNSSKCKQPINPTQGCFGYISLEGNGPSIRSYNAKPIVSNDEFIRIYITVDETGNLGRFSSREREYVVVGCVVMNRREFERASREEAMKLGREIKFNTDPELREKIIRITEPYVAQVYYIRYHKDKLIHNSRKGLPTEDKHDLHLAMMRALANAILRDYGGEIYVDIDANSLVREYEAVRSFEDSPYTGSSRVRANVDDSENNFGLQSNDMYVGSIGLMVNGPASTGAEVEESRRYAKLFWSKIKRVFLKEEDWEGLM